MLKKKVPELAKGHMQQKRVVCRQPLAVVPLAARVQICTLAAGKSGFRNIFQKPQLSAE